MTNPFIIAMRDNPDRFLNELDIAELRTVAEGCVAVLVRRAKAGDSKAPGALQALYRAIANVEI